MKKRTLPSLVRKIPKHNCDLPIQDENADQRISNGMFVNLRRRIWKFLTVDPMILESKRVLKSAAEIHNEQHRHFEHYPNIIHPLSRSRLWWEMFMIPVFLLLFTYIPGIIAIEKPSIAPMYFKLAMDIVCWFDITLFFCTGYYDSKEQKIILKRSSIFKHYVCSYFVFDMVSSFPVNLMLYWMGAQKKYEAVKLIYLLKIVRLPTLLKYMKKMSERNTFLSDYIKFVNSGITIQTLILWTSSISFMTQRMLDYDPLMHHTIKGFPMLMTTFRVIRALMVVGVTEITNYSDVVIMIEIICLVVGSIIQITILARVMQMFNKRCSSKNKYNNLLNEIGEYMKYKELPSQLKEKVLKYVNFKFQKHIFREQDVLNTLSSVLKQDILIHRCQSMVEKVDLFKDLPTSVLLKIVSKLRSEIFLANDVIVLAGYAGNAMYFIYMGTVAVFTGYGREICHLEDGSHFGEIALVINEPRVATVVAVKECEVFKLSRRDFQEAIEPFPELNRKIRQSAISRLETTLQMMSENKEERKITTDSLKEDDEDEIETFSI